MALEYLLDQHAISEWNMSSMYRWFKGLSKDVHFTGVAYLVFGVDNDTKSKKNDN